MKKNFIKSFLFAAAAIVAAAFTACSSDDIQMPDNKKETMVKQTIFFTEDEGTRTSMDTERAFYWELGDKIWVKNGNSFISSSSSNITARRDMAKFIFDDVLNGDEYPVFYTGYTGTLFVDTTSTSATSVTIASSQTQSAWNNSEHLAISGDCGVATAKKKETDRTYHFKLQHKAAYLIFYPYLGASQAALGAHRLLRIEIVTDGTDIAGTYDFDINGLGDTPTNTGTNDAVTLNCGTSGFPLSTVATNPGFVVIHPGTHTLTVNYIVRDPYGATLTFTKEIPSKLYNVNGATTIQHQLSQPNIQVYNPSYWRWGAQAVFPAAYSTSTLSYTDGPFGAARNANEYYWYAYAGDPRWDNETQWMIEGDPNIYTGGVWLKRKQNISGYDKTKGVDGVDMRVTYRSYVNSSSSYQTAGKPAASVISNYFFLPAFGNKKDSNPDGGNRGVTGGYWSYSPHPSSATEAYTLFFTANYIQAARSAREVAYPVGQPWFNNYDR